MNRASRNLCGEHLRSVEKTSIEIVAAHWTGMRWHGFRPSKSWRSHIAVQAEHFPCYSHGSIILPLETPGESKSRKSVHSLPVEKSHPDSPPPTRKGKPSIHAVGRGACPAHSGDIFWGGCFISHGARGREFGMTTPARCDVFMASCPRLPFTSSLWVNTSRGHHGEAGECWLSGLWLCLSWEVSLQAGLAGP